MIINTIGRFVTKLHILLLIIRMKSSICHNDMIINV